MGDSMILAADTAENLGRTVGFLAIPVIGVVLLVVGLRQRSKSRQGSIGTPPQGSFPPVQQPGSYPPQFPRPAGYPPAPGYGGPPPKPAGKGLIIAGVVILVLGLLGVLGSIGSRASGAAGLDVGDCITNESYLDVDFDAEPVSCDDVEGVYELVTKSGGGSTCPDGERENSAYAVLVNNKNTLCFTVNFFEGECYSLDPGTSEVEPAACTPAENTIKIVKRVDGSSDESVCPPGEYATSFREPPRVYCFTRV